MMKSTTFSRSGVSASGVTEMSTWFDASTGTLVSWLTGTTSSFTLRRLAYSLASSHAGPLHAAPCPVVFSTSQGAFASTPTRSTPAFLIASIRGLAPGAGTGTSAKAGTHNASASSSTKLRSMHLDMVPPERPACTGIYGWLVTIIGEAVRRVKPRAPLSCSPMPGARLGSVDPHARTPNTQVRVIENTYPSSSSGGRVISPEQFEHHGIRHPVHHLREGSSWTQHQPAGSPRNFFPVVPC